MEEMLGLPSALRLCPLMPRRDMRRHLQGQSGPISELPGVEGQQGTNSLPP